MGDLETTLSSSAFRFGRSVMLKKMLHDKLYGGLVDMEIFPAL